MLPLIDTPSFSPVLRGTLNSVVFLLSLVLLERSADVFVDSTAVVAKRLGVPAVLIGLLTAGAEWEELAVVVSSLSQHNPSLALSNVLGSCTANILGSFSIGLVFAKSSAPLALEVNDVFSARLYSSLLVIIGSLVTIFGPGWQLVLGLIGMRGDGSAGRWAGISLLVAFALYVGGIMWGIQKGNVIAPEGSDSDSDTSDDGSHGSDDETPTAAAPTEQSPLVPAHARRPLPKPTYHHVTKLAVSAIALALSGVLLASTVSTIADLLHISQSTAGLTILSIATTLPEKLVALKSGRKAQAGVLVANTVGSNVFLLTLVLGVVWVDQGYMPFARGAGGEIRWIWVDIALVLGSSVLMWAVIWMNLFKRAIGVAMLIAYVVYIVSIFMR